MAATELSADTRARILDAAWARVLEHGTGGVSVKAIAADAGVSRQLVYFHFRNRAGLLTAMARHRDEAGAFGRGVAAARALPSVAALDRLLRDWCVYLPEMLPVARALEAAHVTGDEGGTAWQERMDELWRVIRHAVRRVAGDGRLAPDWTTDSAADWIWARIQPSTFAHLVHERGWTPEQYTERTVTGLLRELVTNAAASGSARGRSRLRPPP
jgi:AcrR family transcriptional regulator